MKSLKSEALLREVVEIAAEVSTDRILRKTEAASLRLTGEVVIFHLLESTEVRFELPTHANQELIDCAQILARTATLAIENSRASDLAKRLQVNEERLRIARDLHDRVLQRIFAIGMSLEGALRKAVVDDVITALRNAIVDLDETVGQIRTTVHSLKGSTNSLRDQIIREIESCKQLWNMTVEFHLRGPIDSVVPKDLHGDLIAVTSELLNNAGKYAAKREVRFEVQATGSLVQISAQNEYQGSLPFEYGNGLENLTERAKKSDGHLTFEHLESNLWVRWEIPLQVGSQSHSSD